MIQVTTTLPSQQAALELGRVLVEQRLAACAQVLGPITSTYRWHGSVTTDDEWLLLLKTREDLFSGVEQAIRAQHPYEVPEIVAVPVSHVAAEYASWLKAETTPRA